MPLPEVSIADVASTVTELEAVEPFQPQGELRLGPGFSFHPWNESFAARTATVHLREFTVPDVFLDTARMLLIANDARVRETNYMLPPEYYESAGVLPNALVGLPLQRHYVLGCNRGFDNHYHWLAQALPAIDHALRRRGSEEVALLLHKLNPLRQESLRLLGYGATPIVQLDWTKSYFARSLSYSEFLNGTAVFGAAPALVATLRRMRDAVPGAAQRGGEIIYVGRGESEHRVPVNEDELIHALDREGVRSILPGQLSLTEQITLFAQAAAVIGVHGAGLTNIGFCHPGTVVYEMLPDCYPNACFAMLAQSAGLHYWADMLPSLGTRDAYQRKVVVPVPVVLARLQEMRARLHETTPAPVAVRAPSQAWDRLTAPADVAARDPAPTPPAEPEPPPRSGWFASLTRRRHRSD